MDKFQSGLLAISSATLLIFIILLVSIGYLGSRGCKIEK
ncbi:hypothetical protein IYC_13204 [Clostridium sporogenes PA 3679]|nr:hypothetical protein IYC_13204 [Clostridium sporogenes PA 3679]